MRNKGFKLKLFQSISRVLISLSGPESVDGYTTESGGVRHVYLTLPSDITSEASCSHWSMYVDCCTTDCLLHSYTGLSSSEQIMYVNNVVIVYSLLFKFCSFDSKASHTHTHITIVVCWYRKRWQWQNDKTARTKEVWLWSTVWETDDKSSFETVICRICTTAATGLWPNQVGLFFFNFWCLLFLRVVLYLLVYLIVELSYTS